MDLLTFVAEVGFPIAIALVGIYFVLLTLKFILKNVQSSVQDLIDIMKKLDNRVTCMTNDIIKIDVLASTVLKLNPDTERISRAKLEDVRKD
jgi:chromosomal replication initiation ATPase DnaA